MQLYPVKASEWVNFTPNNKALLKSVGGVPVNDVFMPIWENPADMHLLRGGRGGGKSQAVFEKQIEKSLTQKYHKCYYGRKVLDTVRGSCFDTICDSIEEMGLKRFFHYSRANTSSMVITCVNGNKFIPFGADKADKLKSIKDPTDIVCEEFDQFTFDDFKDLYPTLRTERGFNQFWGMFNTHGVYSDHWIIKLFFPQLYKGNDDIEFDALENINIQHTFANYFDNHFIDQEDYYNKLRLSAGGNNMLLEAIANGAWGAIENKNPWLYNFDYHKHVRDVSYLRSYPIYLAFDFNNDPFACTIWQYSPQLGGRGSFIHCIDEIVGEHKIEKMCDLINSRYGGCMKFICGDRSGQNDDLGRNQTLYQMLAASLNVSPKQLHLHSKNLEHADSWMLMNTMFWNYPNIKIATKCRELIQDCQKAKSDPKNMKPYHLLKDREGYKMDAFDSARYFFQQYFHDFAQKTYLRVLNK